MITGKGLGDGQLAAVSTAVYTVPAATVGLNRLILIHNDNPTNERIYITINRGAGDHDVVVLELASEESAEWDVPLSLSAGSIVKMRGTSAAGVHYSICGAEVT